MNLEGIERPNNTANHDGHLVNIRDNRGEGTITAEIRTREENSVTNADQFDTLVEEILGETRHMLVVKAAEYSTSDDRLLNLREGSGIADSSKEYYLWHLMTKQLCSIRSHCKGILPLDKVMLREKCGDVRNYTIILEALLAEESE